MRTLTEVAGWVERRFGLEDVPTLFREGREDVSVLGLALEPRDVPEGAEVDALFLHRPFRVGEEFPGVGVLASHVGFDAHLTTGWNEPLARRFDWRSVRPFEFGGTVIGMIATSPSSTWPDLVRALSVEFGGFDDVLVPLNVEVRQVALVNAFRPELVEAAVNFGVDVYLTGQMRVPGARRAREVGLGVVALGHRRTEEWGLRELARELTGAFPDVRVVVYASSRSG